MTGLSKDRPRRPSFLTVAVALCAALAVLLVLPLTSLGAGSAKLPSLGSTLTNIVKQTTTSAQTAVQKATTQATRTGTVARHPTSSPSASNTGYTPPAYGTNPHGQGGVASVSLNPSSTRPYPYANGGSGNEAVVIGRGRSEQQSNGSYDAHTTIAALFGNELIGVDAPQGTSKTGPLNAIQTSVLNSICTNTSELICLTVLAADTSATSNGANTHFQTAGVSSKQIAGLNVNAASADSAIQTSGSCQTASGHSQVAGVSLNGASLATAATSSENSSACSGQSPSQTANSSVIGLGGNGIPLPAPGCANGTPNTLAGIPTLLPIICNADDTTQLVAPFGVREALTVLGVTTGTNSGLLRAATAASESHAVAPPASSKCTDADKDCGIGPNGKPEVCVNGKDPDGDGDCTTVPPPSGKKKCTDADHDCGIGPNGKPEVCVNGKDPDGDGDCTTITPPTGVAQCTDADHDCGIGPNGEREVCNASGADPDGDGDCATQVTAVTAKAALPFTGENVLEVVLVGLLLTGGGLTLAARLRTPHKRRR
jgi:hypothetical protein